MKQAQAERIAIVDGLRTPFARQSTVYRDIPAVELGRAVVQELLFRQSFPAELVDLVVFGQVIQMPAAPNIAREIVLSTGLPVTTDAYSVTRACATSFQAIANAAQAIQCGQNQIAVAGGADSASVLPIGVSRKLAGVLLDLSKARNYRRNSGCWPHCGRVTSCLLPLRWRNTPPACAWVIPPNRWQNVTISAVRHRMRSPISHIRPPHRRGRQVSCAMR